MKLQGDTKQPIMVMSADGVVVLKTHGDLLSLPEVHNASCVMEGTSKRVFSNSTEKPVRLVSIYSEANDHCKRGRRDGAYSGRIKMS